LFTSLSHFRNTCCKDALKKCKLRKGQGINVQRSTRHRADCADFFFQENSVCEFAKLVCALRHLHMKNQIIFWQHLMTLNAVSIKINGFSFAKKHRIDEVYKSF